MKLSKPIVELNFLEKQQIEVLVEIGKTDIEEQRAAEIGLGIWPDIIIEIL
jgi:hypothetical protein